MSVNPKDIVVNTSQIDYDLIRDYSTWIDFYNACPLIQDLGESVKTYNRTFRIFEDSTGLLMSNGIFLNKSDDILHTPTAVYKQQYAKLLLGYKSQRYLPHEYYADRMIWFFVNDSDADSIKLVRNNSILQYGFINAGTMTLFKTKESLNSVKNCTVYKNASTYVTQKVEYTQPHEEWYSISYLDNFTPYDRTNLFSDFSTEILSIRSRLNVDITAIANIATGCLLSAYGADKSSVIPVFLNLSTSYAQAGYRLTSFDVYNDNTDDILYHGYLGWEYLYNFDWSDYKQSVQSMNQQISETYSATTDMIKYIVPPARFVNCVSLNSMDRHFGIARRESILTDRTTQQIASILSHQMIDSTTLRITSMYNNAVSINDMTLSALKSAFFTLFPDLSTASISNALDDITDFGELYQLNSIPYMPILVLGSDDYATYCTSTKLPELYVFTLFMSKILDNFILLESQTDATNETHQFKSIYSFTSNIQALNVTSYLDNTTSTRYTDYVNKIIALNAKFKLVPLQTNFFNPSIIDQLAGVTSSIATYSSGSGFRTNVDMSVFDIAQEDCRIEFNENALDDTLFFLATAINDLEYAVFRSNDVSTITYSQAGPSYIFIAQKQEIAFDSPDNIKLVFENDNTRLSQVPVDIENSNIASIPYKGLLLLSDVTEGENIELTNLWIQRDMTSSVWQCKLRLLKYDSADVDRSLVFKFYGDSEKRAIQKLAYEFGLGFELVSSENIDNIEIMRLLYIILSQSESSDNIIIEKVMQDPSKLRMIFRKLTGSDITLRTVLGYKNDESIISTVDYTV